MSYEILKNMKEITATYKEKEKEMQANNIILIQSASSSNIFPGYDVLIAEEGIYLAPQENYDNKGHLDNSSKDAIFLGKEPKKMLFNMLGSGLGYTKEEYQKVLSQFLKKEAVKAKMCELDLEV